MARARMRRRSSGSRRASVRKPVDWVTTLEGWDDEPLAGTGLPQMDITANTELAAPLMNTWESWGTIVEDTTAPTGVYTRGMPWPRRRVLRVAGWIHFFASEILSGQEEGLLMFWIQRFQVARDSGAILLPLQDMWSPISAEERAYFRHQRHFASFTGYPDENNVMRGSVAVNARMNVQLDEQEVVGLRVGWRMWSAAGPRMIVRPRLRTLVQMG